MTGHPRFSSATNRPAMGERGVILVTVIWVMLILTVIAWTFARQSQMEIRMAGFQADSVRAFYMARAGVARAFVFLREDKLKDQGVLEEDDLIEIDDKDKDWVYDAPSEAWGYFPAAYGIDRDEDEDKWGAEVQDARGKLFVEVEDASGRLNLNGANQTQLRRLLEVLGVEEDYAQLLAGAIIDYIDSDDQPTIVDVRDVEGWEFGEPSTEDYYYNPYQSPAEIDDSGPAIIMKNSQMNAVEELLLVPGMTELIYHGEDANGNKELDDNEKDGDESPPFDDEDGYLLLGLKDFVTVQSGLSSEPIGKPNLNSAPLEVITAMLWGEEETSDKAQSAAERLVSYRNGSDGFLGTDDDKKFRTLPHTDENSEGIDKSGLDEAEQGIVVQSFGVASDYFRIRSTGEVNKVKKTLNVTVLRNYIEELELEDERESRFDREVPEESVQLLVVDFEEEG